MYCDVDVLDFVVTLYQNGLASASVCNCSTHQPEFSFIFSSQGGP